MVSMIALKGLSESQAIRSPNCSGNQMIGVIKKKSCIKDAIMGETSRKRAQTIPRKKAIQKALTTKISKPPKKANPAKPGEISNLNITTKTSGRLCAATKRLRKTQRKTCTVKGQGTCLITPSPEIKHSAPSVIA